MTGASDTVSVSAETARRFVLGKQGLWPGRRWTGRTGTRDAIVACEHLQLDPLVIVARSHDLMLHSRVVGYRPALFDSLAYEERLFFDWGGWLAVRPMAELPYWRTLMHRHRVRPNFLRYIDEHGASIKPIRDLLHERGTLTSRDFAAADRRAVQSYRGSKDSSLVLYYLWLVGEAMTHHREGFERVYAPTEAIAPAHLLERAGDAETDAFIARKEVAFAGIGTPGPLSRPLARTVGRAETTAIERGLVESEAITAVHVDGWPGRHFVVTSDLPLLDEVANGRVPAAWKPVGTTTEEEVALLSPLDPVVDRRRAKDLFGFEYVWEIYKRAADVKFGRFAMPILWRDQLAGRIDLRTDRSAKTLVVNGVWTEARATARTPEFLEALRTGVQRTLVFLEAARVDATAVADTRIRRALASLNPRPRAARR